MIKGYSETNIRNIFLMMGSKCNFKCRHCLQTEYNDTCQPTKISNDVVDYLNNLVDKVLPISEKDSLDIKFWGGEPLLYMNTIQDAIRRMGNKFSYSIVTNGMGLTQEIVDYINKNNISVALSNDGINSDKVRGINVLEIPSIVELFKKIDRKTINFILTPYTQNIPDITKYFASKGLENCFVNMEFLIYNWDMPKDLYGFDLYDFRDTMSKVVDIAYQDTKLGRYSLERSIAEMFKYNIIKNVKLIEDNVTDWDIDEIGPKCNQTNMVMNIDLVGNVYACHNSSNKIGTINDSYYTLADNYQNTVKLSDKCLSCKYLTLCKGGCPLSISSVGNDIICEVRKIIMDSSFQYINKFNGDTLLDVEFI